MNAFCFVAFTNYFQSVVFYTILTINSNNGITTIHIALNFCTIFQNDLIIFSFCSQNFLSITAIYIFCNCTILNTYSVAQAITFLSLTTIYISTNFRACNVNNVTGTVITTKSTIYISKNIAIGNIYSVTTADAF